jgi:CHAT domain-containing protein
VKTLYLFLIIIIIPHGISYCQHWKIYADSAKDLAKINENEKAVEYYILAKDILVKDSAISSTHAAINDSLGKLYISLQKFNEADTNYKESKDIKEKLYGTNSLNYALGMYNLGYLYTQYLDRYAEARTLLEASKTIFGTISGKENINYALTCKYLGTICLRTGELENALKLYLGAKNTLDRLLGEDNIESTKIIMNIGAIYTENGNYLNAEAYYRQGIDAFKRFQGEKSFFYLSSLLALANLYYNSYQYYKALPIVLETRKTIEELFGKSSYLYNYNSAILGQVYREQGNLDMSENIFLELLGYYEKTTGKETEYYAAGCFNLAWVYFYLGQFEKSEKYYLISKNVREAIIGKNTTGYVSTCTNLAELYIKMKFYEKADSLLLEAKQIREFIEGRGRGYLDDCYSLGNLYLITKQYAKAEKILLEGIQVDKLISSNNKIDNPKICASLADLYFITHRYDEAMVLYLEAKSVIERDYLKEHPERVQIYQKIATLEWKQKHYDNAYAFYKKSLETQKSQLNKVFLFTSQSEKQAYLNMVSNFSDCFYSFDISGHPSNLQGFAYNTAFENRDLTLSSYEQLNRFANTIDDTSTRNKYNSWVDIKKQLANFYTQNTNQSANISALEEKANILEKDLTRLVSSFNNKSATTATSWEKIQQKLKPDEAAIEFVAFNYYDVNRLTDSIFYTAFLLRKGIPEPKLIRLFEEKQLDSVLKLKSNKSPDNTITELYTRGIKIAGPDVPGKSLYDLIWKPMERHLMGIKKVYYSLAGNLHKISLAALPVNNKYVLSDKYELVQLNTTASLADQPSYIVSISDKIKLVGGIQYDLDSSERNSIVRVNNKYDSSRSIPNDISKSGSWNYLPGTEIEIKSIEKMGRTKNYSINISFGAAATEESIKALSGAQSPVILHIATHGFFFPDSKKESKEITSDIIDQGEIFRRSENPLFRSGLLFAGANYAWNGKIMEGIDDGILTSYEVSNMYLPNTKLVVLSACETALGDINGSEGVFGLQRAFKMAGVQNLVMSLWKVPDMETSEFMEYFYKDIFSKKSISYSFHHAQSIMKNKYRSDPYKWAAWVLIR